MLANYLIGLREGLEAALIVSILISYVSKIGRRDVLPRMYAGIVLAVLLALGVGAALTFGTQTLTFAAQEALGGGLSIVAVGFVTWMIFWMTRKGRTLSASLRDDVDRSLLGNGWAIASLAFLTVGREGVETSLFIWSAVQATGQTVLPVLGASLGIVTAVIVGVLLSRGLIRINTGKFFTVTGGFLILVAAGVLAYGVHDLQEASVLPGLNDLAFNATAAFPQATWYGATITTLLAGFLNFSLNTTWLQAVVWVVYVAIVTTGFVLSLRRRAPAPTRLAATPVHEPVRS